MERNVLTLPGDQGEKLRLASSTSPRTVPEGKCRVPTASLLCLARLFSLLRRAPPSSMFLGVILHDPISVMHSFFFRPKLDKILCSPYF